VSMSVRGPVIRSSSSASRPILYLISKTLYTLKTRLVYDDARSAPGRTEMVSALPNYKIMHNDKYMIIVGDILGAFFYRSWSKCSYGEPRWGLSTTQRNTKGFRE